MRYLVFAISMPIALAAWSSLPAKLGWAAATLDTTFGRYQVLRYGLPMPWHNEYRELMRKRYGVDVRAIAGCVVFGALVDYASAYNSVSTDAIKRKYGQDIMERTAREVGSSWRRERVKRKLIE